MKIGFVGVGAMGGPMAINLIGAGFDVSIFDVAEARAKEIGAKGAKVCQTSAELAAQSDIVISSLPNAAIVQSVYAGENGVFANCKPDSVVIDMSSVAPQTTIEMAAVAREKGIHYMDAPVSGGVSGAEKGTLTIMVGADDETFEKTLPVLNVLGKNIYHLGGPGAGDAMKLVNNLLLGCNMAAVAEALVLGAKCGLTPKTMLEVIKVSSGNSYAFSAKMESFIMEDAYNKGFAVDLQYKDLNLARDAAKAHNAPLPMSEAAVKVFEGAREQGLNREDISSIIKVYEQQTGAKVSGRKD